MSLSIKFTFETSEGVSKGHDSGLSGEGMRCIRDEA